ncbi:Activator of basal transcription 1 [Aphelenchoides bicaudatus]|nr:Activator of basal transcription 1 [Aphelenchoides bicaudatus]
MPQLTQVIGTLYEQYEKSTPRRLKLIDAYLFYILLTGVIQFVYGVVFGTFPFNAFLAGFISTVASFVLAVCFRIQVNPENQDQFSSISVERAFGDFIFAHIILHLMYEDDIDLNTIVPVDYDEDQPTTSENGPTKFKDPEKGTGIIYLSTIPPAFNASKIRDAFSNFGDVGRIYLQIEKFKPKNRRRRFVEGWVEFKKKSVAKEAANRLNGQQVGGKRRTRSFDSLWCLKYLSGFKWSNLVEQLSSEKRTEERRMQMEIIQAKKQAHYFINQVEQDERIKKARLRSKLGNIKT